MLFGLFIRHVHKLDFELYKPLNISGVPFNTTNPTLGGRNVCGYAAKAEHHPHQVKLLNWNILYVKVKQSRNRPGVAQRFPGNLGSQISRYSAYGGVEVVSLTHRPTLPPEMFLVLIFTRDWVEPRAMEWSEGDMSLKNPVAPPGIDPGTVRLVAQRLNHYATLGP